MEKDNYGGPFASAILAFVILGGVYQCTKQAWEKVEPQVISFFNAVGIALGHYLIPFVGASLATGFILTQLCKLPREWDGSFIDLRLSVAGMSVIAAVVLLCLGIPKVQTTWILSMWAGILFGGPFYFWFLAKKVMSDGEKELQAIAVEPYEKQIEKLKITVASEEGKNFKLRFEIRALEAEVEKLQLRDKFLSKKEKEESGEKSILDSDDGFWGGAD